MGHNVISLKPETYQDDGGDYNEIDWSEVEDSSGTRVESSSEESLRFPKEPSHMSDFAILQSGNHYYKPREISRCYRRLTEAVDSIKAREDGRDYSPNHNTLPKDLERIAARGIQVYDWLGRQGEDTGLFIDEILTVDEPGLGNYDDIINSFDSAFVIDFQGEKVPIALDFTINSGKGKHSKQKIVDDLMDKVTATCNNKTLPLPFGCTTITFGYLESEDGETYTPSVHRIAPHYAIGLSGPIVEKAKSIIDAPSGNPEHEIPTMQSIQFMTLSLIREQNRLYRKVLDYAKATDLERQALAQIYIIDSCVVSGLEDLFVPPNSSKYAKYHNLDLEKRNEFFENIYLKAKRVFYQNFSEESYGKLMDRIRKLLSVVSEGDGINANILDGSVRGDHPRNKIAPFYFKHL